MDQYNIEVVEVIEDVRIEVSETIEQVLVQILELNDTAVEVQEIREIVNIEIYDFAEDVFIEIQEGQAGEGGTAVLYKRWSQPQVNNTCYTGFSKDLNALLSEPKWAVKRVELDDTETWAGKTTFDQILDDYLTLTYT